MTTTKKTNPKGIAGAKDKARLAARAKKSPAAKAKARARIAIKDRELHSMAIFGVIAAETIRVVELVSSVDALVGGLEIVFYALGERIDRARAEAKARSKK